MSTHVKGSLAVALAIALVACGGTVAKSGPGTDSGAPSPGDSGAGGSDGGSPHDGGVATDSGGGGPTDSGVAQSDSGGGGQTDSGSGPSDSGVPATDASGPTPCPATAPTGGAVCSQAGLECEYGTNPNQECNSLFTCVGGAWEEQGGTPGSCVMGTCPATYASVPTNGTCSPENLECSYPQGTCICTVGDGERVGGPEWSCVAATPTCPSPRPEVGSACSDPGTECDYGACNGGIAISCTNGVWQQDEMIACPAVR